MGKANLQLVNFNKGLITEANPLIQPLGSTRDEQNFTIENDGKRNRRLGMDYESGGVENPISIVDTNLEDAGTNTFRWDLTGDYNGLYVIVAQVGNVLDFYRSTEEALSPQKLGSVVLTGDRTRSSYSLAQVNSLLVVATGDSIRSITYTDEPDTFTVNTLKLEVRDFFGLEDIDPLTGKKIDRGNDLSYRPKSLGGPLPEQITTDEHIYNLTNQGWPRGTSWCLSAKSQNNRTKKELYAISFCVVENEFYPSNADVYSEYVVSSTEINPKEVKAYVPEVMLEGELRNYTAPKGRAILELLNRGAGRVEFLEESAYETTNFQADVTPNSASSVAEFAGRLFYAGFSGKVIDGDDKSPRLNNYLAFSQLVTYTQQASQCYQVADPTSPDDSEVVATDGGIIRISEATNIVGMSAVSNSILIFAENGVWQVMGGSDFGFSAENYQIVKVTERGCVSPKSIVNMGDSIMYWSSDGVYLASTNESGFFTAQDMTSQSIKSFYEEITSKETSIGTYDDFDKTIRWVYGSGNELVYKANFKAWSVNKVASDNLQIKGLVEVSPFVGGIYIDSITVEGVQVTVEGENVVVTTGIKVGARTEVKYLTIKPDNDTYTFSAYNNTKFTDWGNQEGFEEDAYAYMQGAHFTGGVSNRAKQSPYITFHFNKTELGFDEEFNVLNPSSCLIQTSWDWANSSNANKTSKEFQAYRFRRHYIPQDATDKFDNGFETVVSKSKVRGKGKALSVLIKTEPLKDCQIIGWEQEVTINDN